MFPSIFAKATSSGAPITGMIIMGVVQTLLALMTVSPDLSSQFGALVNLAVVTNVVPYILALSALTVILQGAGVGGGSYTTTIAITVIGIAYNVYALYAAGQEAVMGGILVMGLGWLIWLFIAPRFVAMRTRSAPAAAAPRAA
jgi:putrescine:ornithine antiporter